MVQDEAARLQSFEELLDEFRQLPGSVERPRTFMEIAGYPHYENACSNILAFFMDPEESHGLGILVLDALTGAGSIAAADEGVGGNISIEREVSTDAGNRIDILITSDTHAILIENKILAGVSNPFNDYSAYLDRIANGRAKHKLLLTLYPTGEGSGWGFVNLTHKDFVEEVRSLLGRYVSGADTRHLTIFLDFLNTLENLQKGTRMDREFVKFLAERDVDIKDLFANLKGFRTELREKVEELRTLIDTSQHQTVEVQDLWRGDTASMADTLYHNIRIAEDLLVGIDTRLNPQGWEIQIFARGKGSTSKLRDLLQRLDIPFEEEKRFIHHARFAYDEDLNQIKPIVQELIDKLATVEEIE